MTRLDKGQKIGLGIILAVLVAAWFLMQAWPVKAQEVTPVDMQAWLKNPWVLFGFMIFGTILSMVQQWKVAKMDGSPITLGTVISHLQELFTAIGGNILAFFLLVDSGNLNYVSAVSIGYVLNSVADLNPAGSRSTALKKPDLTLK